MANQTNERSQETRKVMIISGKTRKEIDAVVLGSMGCAPGRKEPYRKRTEPIPFATLSEAKAWID